MKGMDHSGDVGVGEMMILRWILKVIGWEIMSWIYLAENKEQWRALMNTVMNLQNLQECLYQLGDYKLLINGSSPWN